MKRVSPRRLVLGEAEGMKMESKAARREGAVGATASPDFGARVERQETFDSV